MPDKILQFQDSSSPLCPLPHPAWLHVLSHPCDFDPQIFQSVSLNLIKNPNINSSLLFRADVLYDSHHDELTDHPGPQAETLQALADYNVRDGDFPGFTPTRTLLRRMIPRNPQLDKPIAQTCVFLHSAAAPSEALERTLVVYIPHAPTVDEIPWYHPRVKSLAYLHEWHLSPSQENPGNVSLYYTLYAPEAPPFTPRLLRTGQHLLSTVHKHGQGRLAGYKKRVHHDQLVSQQRVQDTYTELKRKHANRLCDNWVEKTEPSKHVFEDLGIAAFLIEIWKDMYQQPDSDQDHDSNNTEEPKAPFPGFVDIGCGNGVLVDILLHEGYQGWGFDARKRKTWSTFPPTTQIHIKQMILIPQPLFELHPTLHNTNHAANASILQPQPTPKNTRNPSPPPPQPTWHNGLFPPGTFIISNHADELTPWTPLLASLSLSPFLAIPCCSHNLSGKRFRAPSVFNNHSADALAPTYFAANISTAKSVAIAIATSDNPEDIFGSSAGITNTAAEEGDLNALRENRKTQPSAYSSLCDWVAHLAARVGWTVEREVLRLPSTRNLGIFGRGFEGVGAVVGVGKEIVEGGLEGRRGRVMEIARAEGADGRVWVECARGLVGEGGSGMGH